MFVLRGRLLKNRGLALPFVLLILTLLLVAVSAVAHQGLGTLQQAKIEEFRRQALFAAEAGASDAIELLVNDPSLDGTLDEEDMDVGASYQVTIYNNFAPGGPITVPNGAVVPEYHAYVYSEGRLGTISRRVGVLVRPGSASALGLAIGVGATLDMQGSKRITGSIKANGDIDMQGSTRVEPMDGSGRLLSSSSISVQGSTRIDDTQDALARSGISGTIKGANSVVGNDSSPATEPFIADYRYTNATQASEKGAVLPNPDPALLLAGASVFDRGDSTADDGVYSPTGDIDLAGGVFYYPDGVDLSGVNVNGPGTLVVGNGNPIEIAGSTNVNNANLVAIGGPEPPLPDDDAVSDKGDARITFQGSTRIDGGLVYAHDGIDIQGSFRLSGLLISYDPTSGFLKTQGSTRITLDASILSTIPGFEPWASGFGGVGGNPTGTTSIGVVSWERL